MRDIVLASGTLFIAAAMLASCGSKKDASKANFKAAIQAELDTEPQCIVATLPRDIPSWDGRFGTDRELESLVRAGLVRRTQVMMKRSSMDWMLEDRRPKQVSGYRYDFSDTGKKYVVQVHGLMGTAPALCYGKKKVVDIVRYSEPSPAMGMTVSQVTYTWRLTDIAEWARNPEVEKTFHTQQWLATADTPKEAQASLALSNDGWHVPRMF